MGFFLTKSGMGSNQVLIKAHEREAFATAQSLLAAAQVQAATMDAQAETARREAEQKGFAHGLNDAEACLQSEIAKFAEAIEAIRQDYEARVAEAAYAAVMAIVGTLDDSEIVQRIVANQLAGRTESDSLRIMVAPQMADALAGIVSSYNGCEVMVDPDLPATACRLTTGDARIVADLSLQMETLRQRWGLDSSPEAEA